MKPILSQGSQDGLKEPVRREERTHSLKELNKKDAEEETATEGGDIVNLMIGDKQDSEEQGSKGG